MLIFAAFNSGPDELVSKTVRIAHWFGVEEVPTFLRDRASDSYILAGLLALTIVLFLWAYWWPWWRARHPRWLSLAVATQRAYEDAERHDGLGTAASAGLSAFDYCAARLIGDTSLRVRGKLLPSTKSYRIKHLVLKRCNIAAKNSRLNSMYPADPFVYEQVEIRALDARRNMRHFRKLLKAIF